MKRCPECGRDYNDDSMSFCLDDGAELLFGPANKSEPPALAGGQFDNEPQTAILHETAPPALVDGQFGNEAPTRAQIHTTEKTAVLPSGVADVSKASGFDKRLLLAPLALAVIVLGFFGYRYVSSAKQIESIAVIPFVNKTNNPEMEYLSDGMTETLINSLSKIPNLNVKARSSVFRYKGSETDYKKIADELNVQAILNGDVVQRGEQLILNLELFDAKTENRLWGQTYTRSQTDLVNLQNEIARDVSNNLRLKLSGTQTAQIENNYTANAEAYKLYLKGRFHWNKRRIADAKKSVELFQQAIDVDPNYALGYAGLADAYALLGNLDIEPQREVMPKAKSAAEKALLLDNNLSEARATLGIIYLNFDYDFVRAEREFKLAIEADPNNATSYFYYSQLLSRVGKSDEAIRISKKAVDLEPFASYINNFYGGILHLARRYDEAESQLKRTIELDANFPPIYLNLFSVYQMQGRYAESVEAFAKYQELLGQNTVAVSARESFAEGGWEGFLQKMPSEPNLKIYRNRFLAIFYTALGEKQKAIDELEKEYEKRGSFVNGLKVFPALDPLRDEPRFKELVKRVGIPE